MGILSEYDRNKQTNATLMQNSLHIVSAKYANCDIFDAYIMYETYCDNYTFSNALSHNTCDMLVCWFDLKKKYRDIEYYKASQ